jgi:uncharacterized protein (DUF1697 family)
MKTFIALIRGINVGSTRKLPMAKLRTICTELGLQRPETYIQSGNLIVDAKGSATTLRKLLEKELTSRFGFTVDVIVRAATDWPHYVTANPFTKDANAIPKMVHLCLSRDPIKQNAADVLQASARTGERIHLVDGALWIDYGPNGVHNSNLSPALIDKACGSPTTGRNWNSVLKIAEMIEART